MLQTIVKPIYNFKDSLTEKDFLSEAETGDLLLFYTNNIGAKLQRFFTNSDFDHIAMVIRFRAGDLIVFESNYTHGVAIYEWKKYVKNFDLFRKVTFRKLNYIRKAETQKILMEFLRKNLGKKYDLSISKLLTF